MEFILKARTSIFGMAVCRVYDFIGFIGVVWQTLFHSNGPVTAFSHFQFSPSDGKYGSVKHCWRTVRLLYALLPHKGPNSFATYNDQISSSSVGGRKISHLTRSKDSEMRCKCVKMERQFATCNVKPTFIEVWGRIHILKMDVHGRKCPENRAAKAATRSPHNNHDHRLSRWFALRL